MNLLRTILFGFLALTIGFVLVSLLALSSLEKIAMTIHGTEIIHILPRVRTSQLLIMAFGGVGLLAGLGGMALASHQAAGLLNRLRQATRSLGDVALDEFSTDAFSSGSDNLDREIQTMVLKIRDSHRRYLDASPLTRLPGNLAIEQILKDKMARGERFALCYIDLDDFKAYNDKYGYARGSDLIKMTGEIIYRTKDEHADRQDFVGHIGGDDFVLITSPDRVEKVCESIIEDFDRRIPEYYHSEDRQNGYIEGTDRYGVKRRFPLLSVSIAVVSDVKRSFRSPVEIAKVASEIKDYVKSLPGSNYLIDRRETARWDS